MPESMLSISADTSELFRAMDRLVDAELQRFTKPVAQDTAERVEAEARRRVRIRTGTTHAGITTRETRDGTGYVVSAYRQQFPNLPIWLERGTERMPAYPFFFEGARLEAGGHERRMLGAIQQAIDEAGLG